MGLCSYFTHEPEKPVQRNELRARWLIMVALCIGLFGSYYVFDIPAATENNLLAVVSGTIKSADDDSQNPTVVAFHSNFNQLYALYSAPNTVLPFFGGFIADKLGVRLMGVVFMGLITIGTGIVALGSAILPNNINVGWIVMKIGRVVFGLGGESLGVVQSAFIAQYFQGKELAFALGATLAVARVGSVVNDNLSNVIADKAGTVGWSYLVGLFVSVGSLVAMIWAYYVDVNSENKLRVISGLPPNRKIGLLRDLCDLFLCRRFRKKAGYEPIQAAVSTDDVTTVVNAEEDPFALAAPKEEIHLKAVFKFPLIYWVLTLSCVTVYMDVLVFNNNCAAFVSQKYLAQDANGVHIPWNNVDEESKQNYTKKANFIMSITYLVAGFLTPVCGAIVDKIGYRAFLNLVAATAITGVHLTLGLTNFYPALPLVALGVCYSIYAAALWPSVALVIRMEHQATAYGLITAVQNLGLFVCPYIVTVLSPNNCTTYECYREGWNNTEKLFIGMGAAGIVCGILLNLVDCTRKYPVLNISEAELVRRRIEAGELASDGSEIATNKTPLVAADHAKHHEDYHSLDEATNHVERLAVQTH